MQAAQGLQREPFLFTSIAIDACSKLLEIPAAKFTELYGANDAWGEVEVP